MHQKTLHASYALKLLARHYYPSVWAAATGAKTGAERLKDPSLNLRTFYVRMRMHKEQVMSHMRMSVKAWEKMDPAKRFRLLFLAHNAGDSRVEQYKRTGRIMPQRAARYVNFGMRLFRRYQAAKQRAQRPSRR